MGGRQKDGGDTAQQKRHLGVATPETPRPYTLTHIHIHHRWDQLEIMLDIKMRSVGDGLECQVEQKTGGTGRPSVFFPPSVRSCRVNQSPHEQLSLCQNATQSLPHPANRTTLGFQIGELDSSFDSARGSGKRASILNFGFLMCKITYALLFISPGFGGERDCMHGI